MPLQTRTPHATSSASEDRGMKTHWQRGSQCEQPERPRDRHSQIHTYSLHTRLRTHASKSELFAKPFIAFQFYTAISSHHSLVLLFTCTVVNIPPQTANTLDNDKLQQLHQRHQISSYDVVLEFVSFEATVDVTRHR